MMVVSVSLSKSAPCSYQTRSMSRLTSLIMSLTRDKLIFSRIQIKKTSEPMGSTTSQVA